MKFLTPKHHPTEPAHATAATKRREDEPDEHEQEKPAKHEEPAPHEVPPPLQEPEPGKPIVIEYPA